MAASFIQPRGWATAATTATINAVPASTSSWEPGASLSRSARTTCPPTAAIPARFVSRLLAARMRPRSASPARSWRKALSGIMNVPPANPSAKSAIWNAMPSSGSRPSKTRTAAIAPALNGAPCSEIPALRQRARKAALPPRCRRPAAPAASRPWGRRADSRMGLPPHLDQQEIEQAAEPVEPGDPRRRAEESGTRAEAAQAGEMLPQERDLEPLGALCPGGGYAAEE